MPKKRRKKNKDEISKKLDIIIGLLAIQGKRKKEEQIKILSLLNFTSKMIEKITGIPAGTVRRIRTTRFKK
ncbi:MAG: hypothetical protein ACKKMP_03565 [Candidatus Nealsonbacteria bacterium]